MMILHLYQSFLFFLVCSCCIGITQCRARPNILFIAVDDLRPQMKCYGALQMYTPNLDALASQSLVFDNAMVQQAICCPSRSSFLTGRRPDTTKVWDLITYFRTSGGNFTTLPQYFKENGYSTAGMGKIFHPGPWNDDIKYSWSYPYYHAPSQDVYGCCVNTTSTWWAIDNVEDTALPDGQLATHAIQLMREFANNSTKPFFLAVGFHKPHFPFFAPRKYYDLYPPESIHLASFRSPPVNWGAAAQYAWDDQSGPRVFKDIQALKLPHYGLIPDAKQLELIRGYYSAVSFLAANVGRVLTEFKTLGLDSNTIVLLLGDHGWQLGEHGEFGKKTNFGLATRAPLMIRVPGMQTAGQRSSAIVEFVDIFPTLVDLAELPIPPLCPNASRNILLCVEGVSFKPLVENPNTTWKTAGFSQYPPCMHDVNCADVGGPNRMGYAILTGPYRYIEWVPFSKSTSTPEWSTVLARELYNHELDPGENENVAENILYQPIVLKLSKALHDGWRAALPT